MDIIISNSSDKAIYEQITMQIKAMIMSGELQPGQAIPSMRALAKAAHVSVITVQRAYEDLQRDGFIVTTVGRGSFVAALNKEFYQEALKNRSFFSRVVYSNFSKNYLYYKILKFIFDRKNKIKN